MKELYVYYRIGLEDVARALPQIEAAFNALRQHHAGLHARLVKRPQSEHQETWMEVYTHPGGITPDLQAAIESAVGAIPLARLGARHTEVFETLLPRETQ